MIEQLWAFAANNSSVLARYLITHTTKYLLAFKLIKKAASGSLSEDRFTGVMFEPPLLDD